MIFSRACEHGIRAAIYIAEQSRDDRRPSLKEIAEKAGSPEAFTAKILQQLVRNDIVVSVKGAWGGFEITPAKAKTILLIDIVMAIDKNTFESCVLGLHKCSERQPCPMHHKFKSIKSEIKEMLHKTTLLEMTRGVNNKLTYLKI